jgi:hypothetical protein
MISDRDIKSYYRQGQNQANLTSPSELSSTSDSDETTEQKAERKRRKKSKDYENDWLNSYQPRNSYDLSASEWVQHCKIGALMLNACSAFND